MEIFSLCELDGNKLIYETKKYSINQILEKINNSVVLVLDNNYSHITNFVGNKKYYRYFKNEELNMDKTSYIVWHSAKNNIIQQENEILAIELLINLPKTIKYIKFNDNFNYTIDGLVETNITHIIFGRDFNHSVDNLPWTTEYLRFGCEFNHSLENLPGCMKKIIFSPNCKFNHHLDCLPNSIEYLFLPSDYSKQLDNLPNSISHLELYYKYPHTLNNLPKSLNKFVFYEQFIDTYNSSVKIIKSNNFTIPTIPCYYSDKIHNNNNNNNDKPEIHCIEKVFVSLPENLKFLDLTYSYKLNLLSDYVNWSAQDTNQHIRKEMIKNSQILDNLPSGLEVLKYPANYNLILIEKIPQNIIRLFMSNKFNKSVDKLLNQNFGTSKPAPHTKLTHLVFGEEFNQSVNFLPSTITHLFFGSNFDKSVDRLPNSLIVISFGTNFNKIINNLPPKLEEIELGLEFNQSLTNIKQNVKKIKFTISRNFDKYRVIDYSSSSDNNESTYKYNYDKKISKLPVKTQIYLPNVENECFIETEEFYSIFNEVKDNVVYY